MKYLLSRDGQNYGPYSREQLQQMVAGGDVAPTDWVWETGSPQWVRLGDSPIFQMSSAADPLAMIYGVDTSLTPPHLHWAFVLLLGICTCGIFSFVWDLVTANYVRKLNPDKTPTILFVVGFTAIHLSTLLRFASSSAWTHFYPHGTRTILILAGVACFIWARFRMRDSLLAYYNSVEPIGLYLSGGMTFFLGLWYLQYNLSRISRWKKTGYLQPQ